jgi:hypothetical protein
MAALVIALDESGVLPKARYRDVLLHLWTTMPEEEAVSETATVVESLLGLLGDDGTQVPVPGWPGRIVVGVE